MKLVPNTKVRMKDKQLMLSTLKQKVINIRLENLKEPDEPEWGPISQFKAEKTKYDKRKNFLELKKDLISM